MNRTANLKTLALFALLFVFAILVVIPPQNLERQPYLGDVFASALIIGGTLNPTFDFNLTNQSILQNESFYYDINCSDVEFLDVIEYIDNSTLFEINSSTGVINQSGPFPESSVGNNTIKITCSDGKFYTNQTFILQINDTNSPPELDPVGDQIAFSNVNFVLQLTGSDPDNDPITFGSNSPIFTINPTTGVINFTPTDAQIGNYTINFTVSDGINFPDFEVITFSVLQGPFCGDLACGSGETCATCELDCGACPIGPPPPPSSSAGGGGGGGSVVQQDQQQVVRCDELWECTEWTICSLENIQTRECKDANRCGTTNNKPDDLQECEYIPTCFDGIQNGGETGIDCGGNCEECNVPTCFDGIQNQGEEGIDCGGPCTACEIVEQAKVPTIEIPGFFAIPRVFPWWLLIVILLLELSIFTYDRTYIYTISRNALVEFREKMKAYRPIRRKLFDAAFDILLIAPMWLWYLYFFSNDGDLLARFIWAPAVYSILVPIVVAIVIRHLEYKEYLKQKKEQRLKKTHIWELLQLVKVENELLVDLEGKTKATVFALAKNHGFDKDPAVYKTVLPIFTDLGNILKYRIEHIKKRKMNADVYDMLTTMSKDPQLLHAVKKGPEYMSVQKLIDYLIEHIEEETMDREHELMQDIEELSQPHNKLVIANNAVLTSLYNKLVDIYEFFKHKRDIVNEQQSELMDMERAFNDKVKEISKDAKLMKVISSTASYARVYNSFIDLFNHYSKKHELSKSLE